MPPKKRVDNRPKVALIRYESGALGRALDKCEGLSEIRTGDRVLIKPHLRVWNDQYYFPPFGVLTTSLILEQTVAVLKEAGAGEIMIGEGVTLDPEIETNTRTIYKRLGYQKLSRKYGVRLLDFNEGPYQSVEMAGLNLEVAQSIFEADFLVNLPVLKTHYRHKIALGIENLWGCMSQKSKQICLRPGVSLDDVLVDLAELVEPDLTVIDGIYRLSRGPGPNGRASRNELLTIGPNPLATELVGAFLLGYQGSELDYIAKLAASQGGPIDLVEVDIIGESPYHHALKTPYEPDSTPERTEGSPADSMELRSLELKKAYHNTGEFRNREFFLKN